MTTVADVIDQMVAAGMPEIPQDVDVSGRLRRFGKKKRGWYRLHENIGRTGRAYITGAFGYWGRVDGHRVEPAANLDPDELRRLREIAAQREERERARRADNAARAAVSSLSRWRMASRSGESRYLERKGILRAESTRFEPDGTILVPMVRYDLPRDQALVGVQAIAPDGEKRFARGTAKRGAACLLGCVVIGEPILVGEGYATCMSVRAAVAGRLPVFVAFDAGNLKPVVEIIRRVYPHCPVLVCADDDHATKGNPGHTKAWQLRDGRDVHIIYPVWPGRRGPKDTDFNDLHLSCGLDVVARQLSAPLRHWGYAGPLLADLAHAA